ncbi:MAG: tripartite tricarboxylate transporter permease, partial [Acidobacteriota bacterium]
MFDQLLETLPILFHWNIWALTLAGVLIGVILGALPGVGPAVAVAVLAPLTFHWNSGDALVFLGVLYPSTVYGGSISAILFNIPGHGGSAATVLDGFAMCEKGHGAQALGLSAASSFVGGLVGVTALILFSPLLAQFGLRFGPAENFILGILGLSVIAVVIRTSTVKGLISALLGILASAIGYDVVTGEIRFTFGLLYLQDGIPFVQALIGLFAISQAINLSVSGQPIARKARLQGHIVEGALRVLQFPAVLLRSSLIGTVIGALPGAGMVTASFLSYAETMRVSKHPEEFGKGKPEGIVAAEAANNSAIVAALIPTITLGIPGGAGVAVFLGVMTMHGITPGPLA